MWQRNGKNIKNKVSDILCQNKILCFMIYSSTFSASSKRWVKDCIRFFWGVRPKKQTFRFVYRTKPIWYVCTLILTSSVLFLLFLGFLEATQEGDLLFFVLGNKRLPKQRQASRLCFCSCHYFLWSKNSKSKAQKPLYFV